MTSYKRQKELEEALQKQKEARERLLKGAHTPRSLSVRQSMPEHKPGRKNPSVSPSPKESIQRQIHPWGKLRSGTANLQFFARTEGNHELRTQPWTQGLVDTMLDAADEGGVYVCLVWPARLESLALLHALVNVERNFARDLRGMRTLMYPGSYTTRTALQEVLVSRERLSDFYRSLWVDMGDSHNIESHTRSVSFEAMLNALNDIRIYHPEVANPSLGELVPAFMYEPEHKAWASVVKIPLERSLKKVEKLAHRRNIREKVNAEWGDPKKAPGALMVLHHSARKDIWKKALVHQALGMDGRPEILLLDATSAMDHTSYSAVKRIPDFLRYAYDNGYDSTGAVIVTDDPKTFFMLRARLNELKLSPKTKVWAAEADETILSTQPVPADWKPEQKSNANFSVGIVDRDASQVALAFQRLAQETGTEESTSYQALMAACLYVLRLSNMPAGYRDLTADAAESGGEDFGSQRNAWTPVLLGIRAVLESGVLNKKRAEAEKALQRAEQLIDDWTDATPMAARLLAEVRRHAVTGRNGLSVVLPNKKHILLAHRFLQRKLGSEWPEAEGRLDWHTLASVGKTLSGDRKGRHFAFVGVNRNVLRLLVAHPDIPHGTTVLISYKQAESTLITLTGMKELEALKPYRGRIGLLAQEIDRRLKEVPNPLAIGRLGKMSMMFKLEDSAQSGADNDQAYYKFELEGGGRTYASRWVYRFDPDEDPPFRRAAANSIRVGDLIFEMSDALRSKLESALQLKGDGLGSVIYPERALLKLYHDDVQNRCASLFKSTKRSALAREIHAKMTSLDPKASDCQIGRVNYWLALNEGDNRPHAPKDSGFFKVFCKALEISDDAAVQHWNFIRNARRLNQNLGRELSARYAEILFQPESAIAYRKVPEAIIKQLLQDALRCVQRVERVVPPETGPLEEETIHDRT